MKDSILKLAFLCFVMIIFPIIIINISNTDSDINYTKINVYNTTTKECCTMNTEEYLIGVLAAEMPASFDEEALKAQAVAARTYSLKKINNKDDKHFGADLCTDFSHCQAYCTTDEMKDKWGINFKKYYTKIKKAVISTKGETLMYNNDMALTVFHSCSNGKTENAHEVWGGSIPYLVSVESKGDINNPAYVTEYIFSKNDFLTNIKNKLNANLNIIDKTTIIKNIVYSTGDNVEHIMIGDTEFKGTDIRKVFDLKSTSFDVEESETDIKFKVYGNGHGVGMSQYGANDMAQNNYDYADILNHYYPGTHIKNMYNSR